MSRSNGGIIGKVNQTVGGDGDGTSSTLTSDGTFTIPATVGAVDLGLVAGGGGGGEGPNVVRGGCGAGGVRVIENIGITGPASAPAVIGAGGAAGGGKNMGVATTCVIEGTTYSASGGATVNTGSGGTDQAGGSG